MKMTSIVGTLALLVAGIAATSPATAQNELDRLESDIRASNGSSAAVAPAQRPYLGAFADDDASRGVRVLSVRSGGPADRAGLQPQDLIVGAAGRKIRQLSQLTEILNSLKPGDHLSLELLRGNRPLPTVVVLGTVPGAGQSAPPAAMPVPPAGATGAGRTEPIPPPPGDLSPLPGPTEGPALVTPANPFAPVNPPVGPPGGAQTQIEELRHRVDQLEKEVKELHRQLAELQRSK